MLLSPNGADDGGGALVSQDPGAEDAGTPTSTSGGGSSGSGGQGSGDPFPVCPGAAPGLGTACGTEGQGCAYVDYDKQTCISFVCSGAKWVSSTPAGC